MLTEIYIAIPRVARFSLIIGIKYIFIFNDDVHKIPHMFWNIAVIPMSQC